MGYDQALLSLGHVKGKQVGIGFSLSTPVVYFNADLLRKAGLNPDKFPTTWDGIIEAAKKAKAANPGTHSMHLDWEITGNWMWQALVFSNGGTMLTADEKKVAFDGAAGKTAINTLAKAVKEGEMRNFRRQRPPRISSPATWPFYRPRLRAWASSPNRWVTNLICAPRACPFRKTGGCLRVAMWP